MVLSLEKVSSWQPVVYNILGKVEVGVDCNYREVKLARAA